MEQVRHSPVIKSQAQERLARLATASAILPRLRMKKVVIAIVPRGQKLTKEMTKWDSAHKFGMASTAQYIKMMS